MNYKDLDIWKIAGEVVKNRMTGKKLFYFIKAVEKEHDIKKLNQVS